MNIVYKLTNQDLQTRNGFQWKVGKWYETNGEGGLCNSGWLHAYNDPLVAVFMNPIHAGIKNPVLWKAEGDGKFLDDDGLKCGYTKMRIVKKMNLPEIPTEKLIEVSIILAIEAGCYEDDFIAWALHWTDGSDRSQSAAAAWAAATEGMQESSSWLWPAAAGAGTTPRTT